MIGIGPPGKLQRFDVERTRGKRHLLAVAGALVGALTVDLHRGKLRRDLHDVADEGGQRGRDRSIVGAQVAGRDHLALGIVGVGRPAPAGS